MVDLLAQSPIDPSDRDIILCYDAYMRQVFGSQTPWLKGLIAYPKLLQAFVAAFHQRFDPSHTQKSNTDLSSLYTKITDDALRQLWVASSALLAFTVRTNFYQKDRLALAIKIIHKESLDGVPAIESMLETFVYHEEFEATHIRSQPIARGGIRWSSRPDFRTEVLQLLRTQILKNTIVVPGGAKGAFLLKEAGTSVQEQRKLALVCYQRFIDALLSITDNRIGKTIQHPTHVKCHDGNDPYLVVATDRGTATFSDDANAIAHRRDFWLDDAFASGGSQGYDHKGLGITARGAWISVYHHLAALGIERGTPLRVVGVGDMSGDIFGNGMLLYSPLLLVGAFDRDFIFIDPQPDLDKSLAERQRLFRTPHSRWADYDKAALSQGGSVFSRHDKTVTLSPEIQKMLHLNKDTATPDEVIVALLKMPADLLWLGGIGTFIKGKDQNDAEVEDSDNDAIRITGSEVGARIVAEGANLGCTQEGRVAYALKGGHINVDALDNSAGVDCSDREVNLKIFFYPLLASNQLAMHQRNTLLKDLTNEVCDLVLKDNDYQNKAVSYAVATGTEKDAQLLLSALANANILAPEDLDEQSVLNRYPLVRPNVCILLSYAKTYVRSQIEKHIDLSSPCWEKTLRSYFPMRLQKAFPEIINKHLLRDAITCMALSNTTVNVLGPFFLTSLSHELQQPFSVVLSHALAFLHNAPAEHMTPSIHLGEAARSAIKTHHTAEGCSMNTLIQLYSNTFPGNQHTLDRTQQ